MCFEKLNHYPPDLQAFKNGDERKFDFNTCAKNGGFTRDVDRIFELIWPNVFDRLFSELVELLISEGGSDEPLHVTILEHLDPVSLQPAMAFEHVCYETTCSSR